MGWPGPMTHRQFLAWRAWADMQWNNPDRHDHYLMQLAVAQGVKDPYITFPERQPATKNFIPSSEQKYKSTTDDPSGWWVPGPLTIEQMSKIGLATRVRRG